VKVVLTGEGSDELLAGYGKYPRSLFNWRAGAAWALAPEPFRAFVADTLVPRLPTRLARYATRSFLAMPRTPEAMFFDNFAAMRLRRQAVLLAAPLRPHATYDAAYAPSRAYFELPNGHSTTLDRLLYADLKTYLVELLMKQDQMSMAASIESRVPFLDHHLVEFAAALPPRMKLRGLTTKWILRQAVKGLLPRDILTRPKMGFPVPLAAWVRGPWNSVAREVLLDRRTRERGLIDPGAVARLLEAHAAGTADGSDEIWSLLNLELWYRTFIDGDGVQTLPAAVGAESAAGPHPAERASPGSARPVGRNARLSA
jgi:asparagine synthase (glutamine-hydrolysing)